jgi:hypothetical protein
MEQSINVRMPASMRKYLEEIATAQMLKVSDVIRMMILDKMPDEIKAEVLKGENVGKQ